MIFSKIGILLVIQYKFMNSSFNTRYSTFILVKYGFIYCKFVSNNDHSNSNLKCDLKIMSLKSCDFTIASI